MKRIEKMNRRDKLIVEKLNLDGNEAIIVYDKETNMIELSLCPEIYRSLNKGIADDSFEYAHKTRYVVADCQIYEVKNVNGKWVKI